jgi:hypothetical protein
MVFQLLTIGLPQWFKDTFIQWLKHVRSMRRKNKKVNAVSITKLDKLDRVMRIVAINNKKSIFRRASLGLKVLLKPY